RERERERVKLEKTKWRVVKAAWLMFFLETMASFWPFAIVILLIISWRLCLIVCLAVTVAGLVDSLLFDSVDRRHNGTFSFIRRCLAPSIDLLGCTIYQEQELDQDQYVFAHSPHGVWFFGFALLHFYHCAVMPHLPLSLMAHKFCFWFPIYR
ncbi:hypothetical protein KIPB_012723, partial [Kipferlia bialata]